MEIYNNTDINISKPVLFNCWKHHKLFIQNEIKKLAGMDPVYAIDLLKKKLLIIGESQTDIYLGNLSPLQIVNSITNKLKSDDILEFNKYRKWILEYNSDYKTITIDDGSCWTLRIGEKEDQYVHIHPCRNSFNSLRLRASNLKTAISVIIYTNLFGGSPFELTTVNKIRKEFLSECPVKSLEISKGLTRIIQLLYE